MSEPTMADIAAHLGVSRQLVSIVLRDMPGASESTRVRVRRAARDLGYRPHLSAQTLRQTRSRQLGVAFTPAHASEPDIVEAIYPAAAGHGYQVVLSARTRTRSMWQAVEELLGYRCAAVVVIGSEASDVDLAALTGQVQVPVVAVGSGEQNPAFDVVRSTGDQGVELAVRHLLALGHTEITYVDCAAMPSSPLRRRGYGLAMAQAALAEDVLAMAGTDYTEEAGAEAARLLLGRPRLPTAVVTGADQQAVGVIGVLARAGVSIPDQVSVTGFDDSRFARLSSIQLTTARQDPDQLGRAAVEAAVRRIDDPDLAPGLNLIETSLAVRSSTAGPRR